MCPSLCMLMALFAGGMERDLTLSEDSVMAVITHKGGIAKGLAHNHFIVAGNVDATLQIGNGLESFRFTIEVPVESLLVDPAVMSEKWYPSLEALGILDEPFGDVSEKDRRKIRKSMLGKSQLRAADFSTIHIEGSVTATRETTIEARVFSHIITARMTLRDVTREIEIPAVLELDDGVLHLEATASLAFSDFGIKPYSAMFGAVSNKDGFDLFVSLDAE